MRRNAPDAPSVDDASCRAPTGTTLTPPFAGLDRTPALVRIRRDEAPHATWHGTDEAPRSPLEVPFADKGEDKGKGVVGITRSHPQIRARRDADVLRSGWGHSLGTQKACVEGV